MPDCIDALLKYWTEDCFCLPVFRGVRAQSVDAKRKVLTDLFETRIGSAFHSYETDRRWLAYHAEEVVSEEIVFTRTAIMIPVRGKSACKLYFYGQYAPEFLTEVQKKWSQKNAAGLRYYWVSGLNENPELKPEHFVYYQSFDGRVPSISKDFDIRDFRELPLSLQKTFPQLQGSQTEWVGPLNDRLERKKSLGPVFCAIADARIVGALGPVDVFTDIENNRFLAPSYFAVDENYRRKGFGGALREAMGTYALENRVLYKILQAQCGSAADGFYKKEGLALVGSLSRLG